MAVRGAGRMADLPCGTGHEHSPSQSLAAPRAGDRHAQSQQPSRHPRDADAVSAVADSEGASGRGSRLFSQDRIDGVVFAQFRGHHPDRAQARRRQRRPAGRVLRSAAARRDPDHLSGGHAWRAGAHAATQVRGGGTRFEVPRGSGGTDIHARSGQVHAQGKLLAGSVLRRRVCRPADELGRRCARR